MKRNVMILALSLMTTALAFADGGGMGGMGGGMMGGSGMMGSSSLVAVDRNGNVLWSRDLSDDGMGGGGP